MALTVFSWFLEVAVGLGDRKQRRRHGGSFLLLKLDCTITLGTAIPQKVHRYKLIVLIALFSALELAFATDC